MGLCQKKRVNFESTIQVSRLFQIVPERQQQCEQRQQLPLGVSNGTWWVGLLSPTHNPEPRGLGATERQESSPKLPIPRRLNIKSDAGS